MKVDVVCSDDAFEGKNCGGENGGCPRVPGGNGGGPPGGNPGGRAKPGGGGLPANPEVSHQKHILERFLTQAETLA